MEKKNSLVSFKDPFWLNNCFRRGLDTLLLKVTCATQNIDKPCVLSVLSCKMAWLQFCTLIYFHSLMCCCCSCVFRAINCVLLIIA